MKYRKTARTLNEDQNFAGVNVNDLVALCLFSLFLLQILSIFNKSYFALPFIFLLFSFVALVRQTHRRKIFRDSFAYFTNGRVVDVTDYNRKNKN